MYDILELKSKLLTDLQDIAKNLNVPKYRSLKKMDLIYQILDVQAINPKATKENKSSGSKYFVPKCRFYFLSISESSHRKKRSHN